MLTYGICTGLLLLAAWCKGIQDSIAHHNSQAKRGAWWNSAVSWAYKYRKAEFSGAGGIWDSVMVTNYNPRFIGSTTFLVWTTDAWHCFGMLNMSAWQAAGCLLLPLAWYWQLAAFVAIKVAYGLLFETAYAHYNKQAP